MLKKISMLVLALFLCVGCTSTNENKEEDIKNLSVLLPSGATSVSHIELIKENTQLTNGKTTYEVVGADVITASMTSGSHDIIIAPTNLGIKLINNGANYKLAGVLTTGNLYVVAVDPDNIESVVAFNENAVPDIVMKAVFVENEFNLPVGYFTDVSAVQTGILSGEINCALIAEPALTAVNGKLKEQGKDPLTVVFDLQEEFGKISGNEGYPQASIFVKNGTDSKIVEKYITTLTEGIDTWSKDSANLASDISDEVAELVGVKATIIGATFNKLGIHYSNGLESKKEIDIFLSLFGMEATSEDVYYK